MAFCTVERLCIVATASMLSLLASAIAPSWADPPARHGRMGWQDWHHGGQCVNETGINESGVGSWHWMRSPEQEARLVAGLYNRYCVRCHGCDGRGVWDIPDVPDFTRVSWQVSRSDAQLTRLTLEGRGAVMPAFRGTLTLEESAALGRYLRRFGQAPESSSMEEVPPPRRLPPVHSKSESTESARQNSWLPPPP